MKSPLRVASLLIIAVLFSVREAGALDARYRSTLLTLCDSLLATQITDPASRDYGALVCPSINPQVHPLHSRAAEAVYPLAVAYRETKETRYRDAVILLGNWLIALQQASGAWGEEAPKHDGWTGTTSDQLISLAGAYPIIRDVLKPAERDTWERSIRRAAGFIVAKFPMGNINYQPTGAVALRLAELAVKEAPAAWATKADALIEITMKSVNSDGFIVGEGLGVDLGYNLAQSIGYIALYGLLTHNEDLRRRAAVLMKTHMLFVYPNGTVDNSWGTRSFKWVLESGTKTAPGVYFSFALLEDLDPAIRAKGQLCLDYLIEHGIERGLVTYGLHAMRHASTSPPCLYSTFARAQSLATALVYTPVMSEGVSNVALPAEEGTWYRHFPSMRLALVRTPKLMATVSAYGEIRRYARELVSRGGSITHLWMEGFDSDGLVQASSVTRYRKEEKAHMPDEGDLLPLTPRVEGRMDGEYFSNLFDAEADMNVIRVGDEISVSCSGSLRSMKGEASSIRYTLVHRFEGERLTKEYRMTVAAAQKLRIVEPIVRGASLVVEQTSSRSVTLRRRSGGKTWSVEVVSSKVPFSLSTGEDEEKYWCPFPAVEAYPITIDIDAPAAGEIGVTLVLGPQ